ncbi:hypothetical protein M8J76_015171 [Diaphorina citri]|nr:hypothetical protein M8J75_009977 [Diaphorina citri]KAI5727161.1 hypothetical protein M8J76_015171 [Diaphorina citri]KAI5731281.1 hypothetical protein M8J77_007431 [Diaphorina citri]
MKVRSSLFAPHIHLAITSVLTTEINLPQRNNPLEKTFQGIGNVQSAPNWLVQHVRFTDSERRVSLHNGTN